MKKKTTNKTNTERGGMSLNVKRDEREYLHRAARKAGFTNTQEWMLVLLRCEGFRLLNEESPALKLDPHKDEDRRDEQENED